MSGDIINKAVNSDNQLARELMEARVKMRERLLIEGKKPYYKVSYFQFAFDSARKQLKYS